MNKNRFFLVITVISTTIFIFLLSELLLRILPIPGIQFNVAKYDNVTGAIHYPNSTMTYRGLNGSFIERSINRFGYLDVNHNKSKENNIYRIGFFGDSYTEAKQVSIDKTFFSVIETQLEAYNVETLAFGISGYSTLQSYLTSLKYTDYFDLDMVVYVFVENDLGNQIQEINRNLNQPYAVLKNNELVIDNSFRERNNYRESSVIKIIDFLTANSLLMSTLCLTQ
jgi:hypothetical protein